jgi:ADP-heptose:LPS heptosyltransferase
MRHAVARLAVIKPGALGDTLLLAPALRALRESLPTLEITVVGSMPAAGLLKHFGVADAVAAIDRLNLYAPMQNEYNLLRGARVMAFVPLDRSVRQGLKCLAGAATVVSYPSRAVQAGQHTAEYLHQCLRAFFPKIPGITNAPFRCQGATRLAHEKPYAILAPGAGSDAKRAPMADFTAAAHAFGRQGLQPVFIAGEVEIARGLIRQYPCQYPCCQNPTLTELAVLLQGASAVLANDSGPAHLAGMLGAATTVFFGPTEPDVWRPWGPRVAIRRIRKC